MKRLTIYFFFQLFTFLLLAQAPQKIGYQAVIRNSSGVLVANKQVNIRISILQGNASGNAVYIETHSKLTNTNGLVSLEIGAGLNVSGGFSDIAWSQGIYFLKTETDPNGGNNFSIIGSSQLISVPFALYANSAAPVAPVYTQSEINALQPVQGQEVYNSNLNTLDIYVGTRWRHISTYDCGICGDGVLSECEECDDYNQVSGDGCNFDCMADLGYDEPNDTKATSIFFNSQLADKIITTFSASDIDFYQFNLSAGAKIKFTDLTGIAQMEVSDINNVLLTGSNQITYQNLTPNSQTLFLKLSSIVKTKPSYTRIAYTLIP